MVLLRKVIGDTLRARRLAQQRTLRDVSTAANVSLGYLSEIERGHKEASSELLASICDALGTPLSQMLGDVGATFALAEQMQVIADQLPSSSAAEPAAPSSDARAGDDELAADGLVTNGLVVDGEVTVAVHSDGPLRTTLTATRTTPGQRRSLVVG